MNENPATGDESVVMALTAGQDQTEPLAYRLNVRGEIVVVVVHRAGRFGKRVIEAFVVGIEEMADHERAAALVTYATLNALMSGAPPRPRKKFAHFSSDGTFDSLTSQEAR